MNTGPAGEGFYFVHSEKLRHSAFVDILRSSDLNGRNRLYRDAVNRHRLKSVTHHGHRFNCFVAPGWKGKYRSGILE
jgi:hypothetical protein